MKPYNPLPLGGGIPCLRRLLSSSYLFLEADILHTQIFPSSKAKRVSTPPRAWSQCPGAIASCLELSTLPRRDPHPDTRALVGGLEPFISEPGSTRGHICPFGRPASDASCTAHAATLRAPPSIPTSLRDPGRHQHLLEVLPDRDPVRIVVGVASRGFVSVPGDRR